MNRFTEYERVGRQGQYIVNPEIIAKFAVFYLYING